MTATTSISRPIVNRTRGNRMAPSWKVWLLDHRLQIPTKPRPEWIVPIMIPTSAL